MRGWIRESDSEDARLARRWKKGDADAFTTLFNKYQPKVFGIVRKYTRNTEDARDVSQEVFLSIFQNLDKFEDRTAFYPWLLRITINKCIDFSRRKKVRPELNVDNKYIEDLASGMEGRPRETGPAENVETMEICELVRESLKHLSPQHRTILEMHMTGRMPYREIAEVLCISLGTVMSRLHYARRAMRKRLASRVAI